MERGGKEVLSGVVGAINNWAGVGDALKAWEISDAYRSCGSKDFNMDIHASFGFSKSGYRKLTFLPTYNLFYRYTCR
jgi:hypothetical protein